MKFKSILLASLCLLIGSCVVSCKKDKDEEDELPVIDQGISVNRIDIKLTRKNNANDVRTYSFYDTDGVGGNAPITNDTIQLLKQNSGATSYTFSARFYSGNTEVTQTISNNGDKYIVCYFPEDPQNELQVGGLDSSGSLPLGLNGNFIAQNVLATGSLQILLKYQPQSKNGLCGPGTVSLDANMVYNIEP